MGKEKKSASKGTLCKASPQCKLSRARPGTQVVMSKPCAKCGDWKCRAHCRCARQGNLSGHQQSRTEAATSHATAVHPQPVAPVGRAPAPSTQMLADAREFFSMACKDIEQASEVEAATYQHDNTQLYKVLLKRLEGRKRRPFKPNIYVDREQLKICDKKKIPKEMKSRLVSLRTNGASVFVCRGKGKFGSYHPKGLVIDRKYLYYGSPNLTDKSTDNDEWPFRSTGKVMGQVLPRLSDNRQKHLLWDGKSL